MPPPEKPQQAHQTRAWALAGLLLGVLTFGMGMANITGIVMSMFIGLLLIVAMVLPRLLKRRGAPA